ncbi:hypothetical protein RRG08_028257 [Elysia crispata]|uniref:Uncharacterized protein n=1 Tax=Elysia crispata TaxID=231223 RepID=A0AAE0ZJA5_9GAST|nr:hypothetical protein RRG08_028257 [Elysia crispata]
MEQLEASLTTNITGVVMFISSLRLDVTPTMSVFLRSSWKKKIVLHSSVKSNKAKYQLWSTSLQLSQVWADVKRSICATEVLVRVLYRRGQGLALLSLPVVQLPVLYPGRGVRARVLLAGFREDWCQPPSLTLRASLPAFSSPDSHWN